MLRFLTAGESHGPCLTAIVEGFPAGLTVDVAAINHELSRRQVGYGRGGRMKIERDKVSIQGGVIYGETTGAPIALQIANRDWANWEQRWAAGDLPKLTIPRPGHADYAGMVKYNQDDARTILERASARETAARVAVGALAKQLLGVFDIQVGSIVTGIGPIYMQGSPHISAQTWEELWKKADSSDVRCPDEAAAVQMRKAIDAAKEVGDTLGGVFVITATGVPIGLGSHVHWERRLDARLTYAVMSIPAIKGVEIGEAFDNTHRPGTEVHDELELGSQGEITHRTNNAGGIEGGMSNGEPVIIRAAMKPIPTTISPLNSVDLATGEPAKTQYQRSDVCAVPAAAVVGEAMVAWILAEALMEKLGGDSLTELQRG